MIGASRGLRPLRRARRAAADRAGVRGPALPAAAGDGVGRGRVLPRAPDQAMAEMGWFALAFPGAEGGGGGEGGPAELAIIAEQLGRSSLDVAMCFIGTLIPALTIYRWGSPAQ